jgi:hypothetical protein
MDRNALVREPYPSEVEYFRQNPKTAGMATKDNRIILNPFSQMDGVQKASVIRNESARLLMRNDKRHTPVFSLTDEQKKTFSSYPGSTQDRRETIIGRLVSGDPSAGTPTAAQSHYAKRVRDALDGRGSHAP